MAERSKALVLGTSLRAWVRTPLVSNFFQFLVKQLVQCTFYAIAGNPIITLNAGALFDAYCGIMSILYNSISVHQNKRE